MSSRVGMVYLELSFTNIFRASPFDWSKREREKSKRYFLVSGRHNDPLGQ